MLRKSTTSKFKRKMISIVAGKAIGVLKENCIASYEGWLKWCDSFRLKAVYLAPAKAVMT